MRKRIFHFNIAFYALIMGIAGLAVSTIKLEHVLKLSIHIGHGILISSIILFVGVTLLYLAKSIIHFAEVKQDFIHPVKSNFFPGIGKILLIFSIGFLNTHPQIATYLWIAGVSWQFFFTIIIFRRWILEEMKIEMMNPLWFLPVVGNMLAPVAGVQLGFEEISWFLFSIGIIMWGILFTVIMNRIIFHHPLPEKLFPTLIILMAPPVVGTLSLTQLFHGEFIPVAKILYYFALFLFILLITKVPILRKIRFYMSWWALSFPLAVLTTGTLLMFEKTQYNFFLFLGISLYILVILVIILLFGKTLQGIKNNTICIEE